ncbi:hypothetical protein CIK05_01125 [Bdellovibrio sp. qaytius]|nr:hypothetical protein CIK05_01125 [Bdellovibrio sp. qaytius]
MQQSTTQNTQGTKRTFNVEKYPLVELNRKFDVPVERVFNAWTNEGLIKQWWGPETYSCPEAKIDLRVGGQINLAMKGPDGKVMYSGGGIEELVPNEKLVMGDQFTDKNGKPISAAEYGMPGDWPEGGGRITIEFVSLGANQSQINITHQGIPKTMHDDCVQGWTSSIDKLQRFVEHS